jgi:hypothetical protein
VVKVVDLDILPGRRLNGDEEHQEYKEIPAHHPLILSLLPWLESILMRIDEIEVIKYPKNYIS